MTVTTKTATPEAAHGPGVVLTCDSADGRYAQDIYVGGHILRADEPTSLGGADTGPTPNDLLLAALGSCTAITLRMYADRKNWKVGKISVRLHQSRIHAEDCKTCESKEGMVTRITRDISIEGPLDDETRARLLEIADKCPVHRTLTSEVVVDTQITE